MLELLRDALKSPSGSFAFIFAILGIAFYAVYALGKFTTKMNHVDKIDNNIDTIKEDIHTIKAFINVFKETNNQFARSNSPLGLTELGVKVSKELNIKDVIARHWTTINKELTNILSADCNPYDIQQAAISVASKFDKFTTPEELDYIKRYAYENGHSIVNYDLLIAVFIRDNYFKINNIKLEDVDKHDPNKKIAV